MDINALINQAAQQEDQSVAKKGGDFEYVPPPAGTTVGRLIEYIELGSHAGEYQGKPKAPAENVRVTFEFTHPKNVKEIEVEGGKRNIADRISITMPKSQSEKSKFFKLFKALAYGRPEIKHMAQCLNEPFIFDVKHNEVDKGGKKVTYANIYSDGVWHVRAPYQEDPLAGTRVNISGNIPAALSPLKIFLWSNPTKETWDSLFIDGTRTVKEGETEKEVSKNWLQELILSATDYPGSALEQMLSGVDNLPTSEPVQEKTAATDPAAPTAQTQEVKTAATLPAEGAAVGTQTSATATQGDAASALAAIGLG